MIGSLLCALIACADEYFGTAEESPAKAPAGDRPPLQVVAADAWRTVVTLAAFDVEVDGATGQMTATPVATEAPPSGSTGLDPQSFGRITVDQNGTRNTASDANAGRSVEWQNGATQYHTPAGTSGAGACGGLTNTFCATVGIRSFYARPINSVYVEVVGIQTGYTWSGYNSGAFSATMSQVASVPAGYEGLLTAPNTQNGIVPYPSLAANGVQTMNWYFATNGNTANFTFRVYVKGSPTRQNYTATRTERYSASDYPNGTNACSVFGHASLATLANQDDASTLITLPFPFTVYNKTASKMFVTSNGFVTLVAGSEAMPATVPYTNGFLYGATGTAATSIQPNSIYAFWDDLWPASITDSVCTATTGTLPNRQFLVTYNQARFYTSSGPSGNTNLTFTIVLNEASDVVDVLYITMVQAAGAAADAALTDAAVPTNVTRGSSAAGGMNDSTDAAGTSCGDGSTQRCVFAGHGTGTAIPPWVSSANDAAIFPTRWRYTPTL